MLRILFQFVLISCCASFLFLILFVLSDKNSNEILSKSYWPMLSVLLGNVVSFILVDFVAVSRRINDIISEDQETILAFQNATGFGKPESAKKRILELKESSEHAHGIIREKELEIKALKDQIIKLEQSRKKDEDKSLTIRELKEGVNGLKSIILSKEETILKLNKELADSNSKLEASSRELRNFSSVVSLSEKEILRNREQISSLKDSLRSLKEKKEDRSEIDSISSAVLSLKEEKKVLLIKIEQLKASLVSRDQIINDLKNQSESENQRFLELSQSHRDNEASQEETISKLKKLLSEYEQKLEELNSDIHSSRIANKVATEEKDAIILSLKSEKSELYNLLHDVALKLIEKMIIMLDEASVCLSRTNLLLSNDRRKKNSDNGKTQDEIILDKLAQDHGILLTEIDALALEISRIAPQQSK